MEKKDSLPKGRELRIVRYCIPQPVNTEGMQYQAYSGAVPRRFRCDDVPVVELIMKLTAQRLARIGSQSVGYRLTEKLGIISGYNTFFVKYQQYTGLMTEASLYFEHRTFKHLGFGAGATIFPMYITYEGERATTEIRNTYVGAVLYASMYF